jgi:uncharacterized Zn-finger protein
MKRHELIHSKEKPNTENSQKRLQNTGNIDTISHTIDKAEEKTETTIKQESDDYEMSENCLKVDTNVETMTKTTPSKKKGVKKMCTTCNKHFRDNYALKRHDKSHIKDGEMPEPEVEPAPKQEAVPEPGAELVSEPGEEAMSEPEPVAEPEVKSVPEPGAEPVPEAVFEPEAEPVLAKPDLSELDYDETDVKTENDKDKILQPNEKNTVFQSEIPASEMENQKEKQFSCNVCAEKFSWHTFMINHRLVHSIKEGIKNDHDLSLELSMTEPKIKPEIDNVAESHNEISDNQNESSKNQNETSENQSETSFEKQNEVSDDPVKREEEEKNPKCQICNVYTMQNMYKYQFFHTVEKQDLNCSQHKNIHIAVVEPENKIDPVKQEEKKETDNDILLDFSMPQPEIKAHEKINTGEKHFPCKFCNRSFTQSSTLKRHERTHTGEKPFSCNFCDKKFTRKATMKRHEINHSKIENVVTTENKKIAPNASLGSEIHTNYSIAKSEVVIRDIAKTEIAKTEVANIEVAKSETAKSEIAKIEVAKSEVANSEIAKSEIAKSEVAKSKIARLPDKSWTESESESESEYYHIVKGHKRIHTGEKPFAAGFFKQFKSKGAATD